MKVTLVEPRGFCFGVCRALQLLDTVKSKQPYVLHEIVHNKQIIQRYEQQGVHFVDDLKDVPKSAFVVFSAHGVDEKTEKFARKNFNVTDTTCPFVLRIHRWVKELEEKGLPIIIIGKLGHAEILGTLGQLTNPEKAFVVSSVKDVEKLPKMSVVGVAMQTTLSVDDTEDIIKALKKKFSSVLLQNGICKATTERQKAVKDAALTHKMVLVVGDVMSSNAKRLVEVAKTAGADSVLVETLDDVKKMDFPESVAITAAASAPEDLVQDIYQFLRKK